MRQVYTSLRVETVEGVARLLVDAGIEVHIANGRSYHSKRGGQFSYSEPMQLKQQPSLWVRHAEDQPRAREILRNAGLLATTRQGPGEAPVFSPAVAEPVARRPLAWKIRIALLFAVAVAALATVVRHRSVVSDAPAPVAAPQAPAAAPLPPGEEEVRVRIAPPPAQESTTTPGPRPAPAP